MEKMIPFRPCPGVDRGCKAVGPFLLKLGVVKTVKYVI